MDYSKALTPHIFSVSKFLAYELQGINYLALKHVLSVGSGEVA